MPKIKTNRGAAKRFKLTGSGKIKRKKAGLRHILTKQSSGVKRGFTEIQALSQMLTLRSD